MTQSATGGNVFAPKTDGLARLREPFPAEHVGLLPKVTCRDCSNPKVTCQKHERRKCPECGAFVSPAHIHLDYVGHGAVTDRLLEVDSGWQWEPVAWDSDGFPAFICDKHLNPHAFWIRLTVLGVTRLGVGTCPVEQFDAEKVLIGDALRNAAMRFGVALDLWIKGHAEDDERTTSTSEKTGPARGRDLLAGTEPAASKAQIALVNSKWADLNAEQEGRFQEWVRSEDLPPPERLTAKDAIRVLAFMAELAGEGSAPSATGTAPSPEPDPTTTPAPPDVVAEYEHEANQLGDDQVAALAVWLTREHINPTGMTRSQALAAIGKARELRSATGPIDTEAEPADEEAKA